MINEVRTSGLKHQRRSAAMEHYAGLDVSVKETSVCVIDGAGKVIHEVKVVTEPEAIRAVLVEWHLHHRTNWARGGAVIAVALQRIGRSWLTNNLRRDATYEGSAVSAAKQKRPQCRARHRAHDASRSIPAGARQDADEPEATDVANQ